uniref:Beta-defensin n=1 Tax=Prolemur simus TaxID=1328070 RepID=A0A8C9DET8_PROSS
MKLFLVLFILLFEVPTDGAGLRKCFNDTIGYCRKKCKIGEIYEVECLSGKLCCINEEESKRYLEAHKLQEPDEKYLLGDYDITPTNSIFTIA